MTKAENDVFFSSSLFSRLFFSPLFTRVGNCIKASVALRLFCAVIIGINRSIVHFKKVKEVKTIV